MHESSSQEETVDVVLQEGTPSSEPPSSTSHQFDASRSALVLREILTYPTLEETGSPKRKNVKRSIPNFVSGPESMQILLDEELEKAQQLADKRNKMQEVENKKEEKRKKKRKINVGRSKETRKRGKKTERDREEDNCK